MPIGQSIFNVIYRVVGAGDVKRANQSIEQSNRRVTRSMGALARGLSGTRASIIASYGAFAAYGYGIARVIRRYEQFSAAQSRMRVIVASSVPNVERGTRQVSDLSLSVARDLGYSSREAVDSMSNLLETGLGVHESMAIYRNGMELARISGMSAAGSVEFLSDTMNLFRREQQETGETSQQFSRRMAQQLVIAGQRAATDIPQLRQAFRYAATEMSTFGFRSQEVMSALAGLSTIGIRGMTAGTRLRGAIVALHRPTERTKRLFASWGVTEDQLNQVFYDSSGRLRPLTQGMDNLYAIFRQLPSAQARATAMSYLFGQRSGAAGLSLARLTTAGSRTIEVMRELSGNLEVPWQRMLQTRMQGFDMQMRQFREGLSDLAITFGQDLVGGTTAAGEGFGTYTRRLSEAVMLADPANRQTAEARRRWRELGLEMQESGRNTRQFFIDLAYLTKQLAKFVFWLARVSADNPWKAALAGIALWAFGLGGIFRGIVAGVRYIGTTIRAVSTASIAQWTTLFYAAGIFAAIAATDLLIQGIDWAIERWTGGYGEFNQAIGSARDSTMGLFDEWVRGIPLVGTYFSTLIRLVRTLAAAWSFAFGDDSREARLREQQARRSRQWREARGARGYITERAEAMGLTGEGGMRRTASMERASEMQRMAEALSAEGIQDTRSISAQLRSVGITNPNDVRTMAESILQLQRSGGEAMEISGTSVIGAYAGGLSEALRDSANRIRGFNAILQPTTRMVAGGEGSDLIASSRREIQIANAVEEGVSQVVGARTRQQATSEETGRVMDFHGEFTVPVAVNIDGEEISRVVGRQQIQHMQRSGQQMQAGVRRTLRESGFAGRSG